MTFKPKSTEVFTAKHENGATWTLAVNAKRGAAFADSQAQNFARNYCRKHRAPGTVVLTSAVDGRTVLARVSGDYTL